MIVGSLRATRFALQNFWRNLWLSVVTVFLLVLTLLSISLVVGLNVLGNQVITAVQQKVDIDFYVYDSVSDEDILAIQQYMQSLPEVAQVVYVSKDDALQNFRETNKEKPEILASLDELETNILPASFSVRAREIGDYRSIIAQVQGSEYKKFIDHEDFSDNQEVITAIASVVSRGERIGIGVSIVFVIISVIVIFNTIRITIYSHREEVAIMKLVGATNWFIRAPFILESIFLGLIGSLITLTIFYVAIVFADPTISSFFAGYNFSLLGYFQQYAFLFIFGEILCAVLLSSVSSMIAITRYLKV